MKKTPKLKKSRWISLLLSIAIILSILITPSYADYNGTGGGFSNGEVNTGSDWAQSKSGYRISIVDSYGNLVANPVDFVYRYPPLNAEYYWTSKFEDFNSRTAPNRYIVIDEMLASDQFTSELTDTITKIPDLPRPIGWTDDDRAKGQGSLLKQWMLGDLENFANSTYKPSYTGKFTQIGQTIKVDPSTPTGGNEQPEEELTGFTGKGKDWLLDPVKDPDKQIITHDEYLRNKAIEELNVEYYRYVIDKAFSK